MTIPRLLTLTGLAVAGALCAGTAASVYSASLPRHQVHSASVERALPGDAAHIDWHEGAEPTVRALKRRAADRGASVNIRLRVPQAVATGACLNPREMLFGVQPARRQALDSVGTMLGDLPQGGAVVAAARAMLQAFDEAAEVWAGRQSGTGMPAGIPGALEPMVPERLARRVTLCRTLLAD